MDWPAADRDLLDGNAPFIIERVEAVSDLARLVRLCDLEMTHYGPRPVVLAAIEARLAEASAAVGEAEGDDEDGGD